jgi:adenylylsulfate kinase
VSSASVPIPAVIVTGPVGAGKTSVATALSALFSERDLSHALIDLDWLRWAYPSPPDDPFHTEVGYANLAAIWQVYRAAGVERLILVDVIEASSDLLRYQAAIPGVELAVVRLHAPVSTLQMRLAGRETGASLEWHQQRAAVLGPQMERDALEDLRIDTADISVAIVARQILEYLGWDTPPEGP